MQEKMQKKRYKLLATVLIFSLGVAGMLGIKATADEEKEKDKVDTRPTVSVQTVATLDYPVVISTNGEIAPKEATAISAQVTGKVTSIHPAFVAGGVVQRGDILFTIEADNYEAAVLQAESELARAQAALIEEKARADVAAREAKNLPNNNVSDLYLRKPQLLSAEANLKSAQSSLKIAQKNLRDTTVKSPYDALIVSRDIGVGQFVNRGVKIGMLNNIETAEVVIPIAGFDTPFLPEEIAGLRAMIKTNGQNPVTRQGTITRDLGVVDQRTRMSHIVVEINDPYSMNTAAPEVKFGEYVEVQFTGITLQNVYKIPQALINRRLIWTLDADNKMRSKPVSVLREEGKFFLVNDGILPTDRIVTSLPEYPQNGMEVKLITDDIDVIANESE
jgi:multidrug efflux system membrane fusion protein